MEKRIALFCSSYEEIDPAFHEAARQLTCALCEKGYTIVSGGSWRGTMGVIGWPVRLKKQKPRYQHWYLPQ